MKECRCKVAAIDLLWTLHTVKVSDGDQKKRRSQSLQMLMCNIFCSISKKACDKCELFNTEMNVIKMNITIMQRI